VTGYWNGPQTSKDSAKLTSEVCHLWFGHWDGCRFGRWDVNTDTIARVASELGALDAEALEVKDYVDYSDRVFGSTCSSSSSSCTSTCSSTCTPIWPSV
jgi:thiazolylpeptide-type bacteriocin precursor